MAKKAKEFTLTFKATSLVQYVLVLLMIGAAFWTGTLYQQVKGIKGGKAQPSVAGTGTSGGAVAAPTQQAKSSLEGEDWQELLDNPAATLGDANAPVTIVEFTDYQCPFCQRAFETTFPQIKEAYIDTGKVRYLTRDLPLAFHGNAKAAALAARCAGADGKYFEMHDTLFDNQDDWIVGNPDDKFKQYASELGVGGFDTCYDSGQFEDVVDADLALASRVGATGTPTFFINGVQVVGAQPFSAFETVIEAELSK